MVTEVGGLAARLLMVLIVGRYAGPHDLGLFVVATAVASLAVLPSVLGVDTWASVDGARDPAEVRRRVPEALRVVTLAAPATALLLATAGLVLGGDLSVVLVGSALLALPAAPMPVLRSGFAAAGRLRLSTWGGGANAGVTLAAGILAVAVGAGAGGALLAVVAGEAVELAVSAHLYARHVGPVWSRGGTRRRDVLRDARGMASFRPLTAAFQRVDAVLVGALLGPASVGLYGAATNITKSAPMVAASIGEAMVPRLSRPDRRAVRNSAGGVVRLLALAAVPASVGLFVFAPEITRLLYGRSFEGSVGALRILALAVPVAFGNRAMATTAFALGRGRWAGMALGLALAANLAANAALIPSHGITGAAVAAVLAEAVQMAVLGAGLARAGAALNVGREFAPALVAGALVLGSTLTFGRGPGGVIAGAVGVAAIVVWAVDRGLLFRLGGEAA